LGKYLDEKEKDSKKIQYLIKSIPTDLQEERFTSEMKHLFLKPKTWKDNEIAILCGPGFEEWSPDSIKTGLGGSEEAVVYLSEELTKLGWRVTVFANPGKKTGTFKGVKYIPYYDMNVKDNFNVLILWRGIGFADFKPKSKFTMLWMHDIPNNPEFTEERVNSIDKIAPLSEYHRSLLKLSRADGSFVNMPDEKIFLTKNGTPQIKVDKDIKRDPYRMIYASSPDRGLIYLLKMWPDIIKEVPKANLHVYYGFKVYDNIYGDNPAKKKWKDTILDLMKQPGITYHGRVGHQELHEEMSKAAIWAYPTDFCVSGETLIDMPRNYFKYPLGVPIKELVGKKDFLVWTFNEKTGDFELKNAEWVKKTRTSARVIKVNWDDGTSLRCTPDHKVLTYKRGWVKARNLKTGESVVALKKHFRIQVSVGKGVWPMEHRVIAEKIFGKIPKGYHVDHIDGSSLNNSPDNLQLLSPKEHGKKTFSDIVKTSQSVEKQIKSFKKWVSTEEGKKVLSENGRKRARKFWDNITPEDKVEFLRKRKIKRDVGYKEWWSNLSDEKKKNWGNVGRKSRWNHKVVSVENVKNEDVYDMLVKDNHNFVAGGVVIHNCEISCITAMKCQILGTIPVCTNLAALKETVKNGVKMDIDITVEQSQEEYKKELIKILKDHKLQKEIREPMVKWAKDYFGWDKIAVQWDQLFRVNLQNLDIKSERKEV